MNWFTKEDVKNASDVFLVWFGRISGVTANKYDDQIHLLLKTQQDLVINLIARLLSLEVSKNTNASRAPVTVADLQVVCPGITDADVAELDEKSMAVLLTIGQIAQK